MADSVQQKKLLIEQATKAMNAIFRKARRHIFPVDIQLKLFDSLVLPILLHLTFCKNQYLR